MTAPQPGAGDAGEDGAGREPGGNPTVDQLWRYPVKSMQGGPVEALEIVGGRIVGDRRWGVLDRVTGRLLTAKLVPELLLATASVVEERPEIRLPDGGVVVGMGPATDDALSRWLDRAVRLAEVDAAAAVSYEMTFDPPDDRAEAVEIPAPPGSFHDLAALHLVGRATLEHAAAEFPDHDWDVRRFRPNVVVRDTGAPFAEDGWQGGDLAIGTATLRVRQPTVRCAMPLRAQPGLPRAPELYRALTDLHANHLGVYVDVVHDGTVRVEDRVGLGPT